MKLKRIRRVRSVMAGIVLTCSFVCFATAWRIVPVRAASPQSDVEADVSDSDRDDQPEEKADCGPTCAYVVLRLAGIDVTRQQVLDRFDKHPAGASLAEIQRCLAHFGLPTRISKRTSASDLRNLTVPAILHSEYETGTGHYIALYGYKDNGDLLFVDGGNDVDSSISGATFLRVWSGYVIELDRGRTSRLMAYAAVGAVVSLVASHYFLRWRPAAA